MTSTSINAQVRTRTRSPLVADRVAAERERSLTYRQLDWDNECFFNFGEGRDPAPCPACSRTGFYGPRFEEPNRPFRACRFCGFSQNVDGPPQWYRPVVHACHPWPSCARAPYLWWIPPGIASLDCPFCSKTIDVAAFVVRTPSDDPLHPWWRVPQHRPRSYYVRFWENWEPTKGRVYF